MVRYCPRINPAQAHRLKPGVMNVDKEEAALELLPARWRERAALRIREAEEIRLRTGRRPSFVIRCEETAFAQDALSEGDLLRVLEKATGASFHTAQASLSEGFVNYRGIRIGVCGLAALREGETCVFRRVSSLAIRIPRECRGICREPIDVLLQKGFRSTLILGAPGAGKTTVLRELIRRLSDSGYRVGVADERSELAVWDGEGQAWDLGRCTDVISGLPKEKAAMMLLRGMNPGIIAMDEITPKEDMEILSRICGCGVGILASIHAGSREELMKRWTLEGRDFFAHLLLVQNSAGGRSYRLLPCEG